MSIGVPELHTARYSRQIFNCLGVSHFTYAHTTTPSLLTKTASQALEKEPEEQRVSKTSFCHRRRFQSTRMELENQNLETKLQ